VNQVQHFTNVISQGAWSRHKLESNCVCQSTPSLALPIVMQKGRFAELMLLSSLFRQIVSRFALFLHSLYVRVPEVKDVAKTQAGCAYYAVQEDGHSVFVLVQVDVHVDVHVDMGGQVGQALCLVIVWVLVTV